jgi:4-hydroxybenzoate polyprenyltransferase
MMATLWRPVDRVIDRLVRIPYSPLLLVVVPAALATAQVVGKTLARQGNADVGLLLHACLDLVLGQMLLVTTLGLASGRSYRDFVGLAATLLAVGWLGRTAEWIVFGQQGQFFSHRFDFRWASFGAPQELWHLTAKVVLAALPGLIVARLTRSAGRALAAVGGFVVALSLQLYGAPAVAELLRARLGLEFYLEGVTLAAIVVIHVAWHRRDLRSLLPRMLHLLPLALVAGIGARCGGHHWSLAVTRAGIVALASVLLLVAHGHVARDERADNPGPGFARVGDVVLVFFFQLMLIVGVMFLDPSGGAPLMLLFMLGAAYSLPGLRLGHLAGVRYVLHGLAAAACFLFGAAVPRGSWRPWAPILAASVLLAVALVSMLADCASAERDRNEGIGTVYTTLLRHGWPSSRVHAMVSALATVVLLVAPVWLRGLHPHSIASFSLFPLALMPSLILIGAAHRGRAVAWSVACINLYTAVLLAVVPALA